MGPSGGSFAPLEGAIPGTLEDNGMYPGGPQPLSRGWAMAAERVPPCLPEDPRGLSRECMQAGEWGFVHPLVGVYPPAGVQTKPLQQGFDCTRPYG